MQANGYVDDKIKLTRKMSEYGGVMVRQDEQGLEKLVTWQKAMEFAVTVCRELVPVLPKEEKFVLADQIRRAAQSVPAKIAEGYGRYYYQEGIRFCYIARGSLDEVFSHLSFAYRMEHISASVFKKYSLLVLELHRIISGYITYLKRTKQGESEPGHNIHDLPGIYDAEPFPPISDLQDD